MTTIQNVERIVERLIELETDGMSSADVAHCLLSVDVTPASIEPYLHFDATHYTRNLIHRTEGFELLAICWEPGQRAPIHDHENERCWALVHRGTLRFTNYRVIAEEPVLLEQDGPAITGCSGHLDALAGIHRVENPRDSSERAVSIHLYARPFAECSVYDVEQCIRERRRLQYDWVPPGTRLAPSRFR